jgi:hypothetical protein
MEASKSPSMNEMVNKVFYIHAVEYYLVLRKKEILTFVTTWKNIMVSEINQTQKGEFYMIPLT